jgi:K+-sensing histidine kinase KdpD
VREVVDAAVDLLQPLAMSCAIDMVCRGPRLAASADERRLRQVILNLVSNALRFSSSETCVRVETEAGGGVVRIHVVDEGPGIPTTCSAGSSCPSIDWALTPAGRAAPASGWCSRVDWLRPWTGR